MASELDEARLLLDTAERSRRHAENEVGDVREAMNELTRSVWKQQQQQENSLSNISAIRLGKYSLNPLKNYCYKAFRIVICILLMNFVTSCSYDTNRSQRICLNLAIGA